MKCNSLIKDYVSISIPVFVSDSLLALGTSAVAMVMGRIGTGFVSANSITVVTQQLTTVIIPGDLSRQLHYDRSHIGPR